MKKNILFVDDEPKILQGLQRMLFTLSDQWNMEFLDSGKKALAFIEESPIDVIVSDMRMPQMDGATLLQRVQEKHPDIVRIVLSGHSELETAMRAVPVAHQFLSKPCEPDVLEEVVERACGLHALLADKRLRNALGKIDSLPVRPQIYSKLLSTLADSNTTIDQIAKIVEEDMGMCAKILHLVNSAFFGLRKRKPEVPRTSAAIPQVSVAEHHATLRSLLLLKYSRQPHLGTCNVNPLACAKAPAP